MEQSCSLCPDSVSTAKSKDVNLNVEQYVSQRDQSVASRFDTLPSEIIYCIMNALFPREILTLAHISIRLRNLALSQLFYVWDMQLDPSSYHRSKDVECTPLTEPDEAKGKAKAGQTPAMSDFELYTRMVLSDLYSHEVESPVATDYRQVVGIALLCCKRILRRLYLSDSVDRNRSSVLKATLHLSPGPPDLLNPFLSSMENLHAIARVIADQVSRGICIPETAVLVLQSLASLNDRDNFQYAVNVTEKDTRLRMPVAEDRVSFGVLCFQYLIPNVLSLLRPLNLPPTQQRQSLEGSKDSYPSTQLPPLQLSSRLFPFRQSLLSPTHISPLSNHIQSLTSNVLQSQQDLLLPIRIRSTLQLTRVLCFLPLLGRHFNTLPTSTFIETFLDRSKGDLPIDRAAVMVYGFMCVLDLETGKANLASDSYKIFERSMPTHGVVQAQEIIRMMERHRALMRGFLLSSPTFSSTRLFRQSMVY